MAASDTKFGGFHDDAEFYQAVRRAGPKGQLAERRLVPLASGPGQLTNESAGADGGFAAPPGFAEPIIQAVAAPTSIVARTTVLPTERMQVAVPVSVKAPWEEGGYAWAPEAASLTAVKFGQEGRFLKAGKVIALVAVSDEIADDAPALAAFLRAEAPVRLDYAISDAILNGTGVGRPLGLVNARCKIVASKEGGQAAGTFTVANAKAMLSRLHSPSRDRATWIVNPDLETSIIGFGFPNYAPAGVSGYATPTLFGIPIIFHEAAKAPGTEGDVVLADLAAYITILRARTDFSLHVYFDYDAACFRFIVRVGGLPLWQSPVSPPNSTATRSTVVTLEAR